MNPYDSHPVELPPELSHDKIAQAALALLSLSNHDHGDVWKDLDWSVMNLLYKNGWIEDPISKRKSVHLTPEGERRAAEFIDQLFRE